MICSIDGVTTTKKVAEKAERERIIGLVKSYTEKPTITLLASIKKAFVQQETKIDAKIVKKVEKKLAKESKKAKSNEVKASTVVSAINEVEIPKEESPKAKHTAFRRTGEY